MNAQDLKFMVLVCGVILTMDIFAADIIKSRFSITLSSETYNKHAANSLKFFAEDSTKYQVCIQINIEWNW